REETLAITMPAFGRVAQLARARRLQRQTEACFPQFGDQQEQPFVQVSPEYSPSSKKKGLASRGTGWTKSGIIFRLKTGKPPRRFSGAGRHKPVVAGSNGPGLRGP